MTEMVFYSDIDLWMHIAFISTTLIIIALPYLYYKTTNNISFRQSLFAMLIPILFSLSMLLPSYLNTYYKIDDSYLRVRSGIFLWKIPLSEIESIEPTHSFLSAPALSIDRLSVRYSDTKHVDVSPVDKAGFIVAIRERQENE